MNGSPAPADSLSTWNCHAGDLAFSITGPSRWLAAQRAHLSGFLTEPPKVTELGTFSIRIHTDDTAFHRIVEMTTDSPVTCQVEPVPGVVMLEAEHPDGHRTYVLTADAIEHQAEAYAVAVRGRHIDLFIHSGTTRPHRYPIRLVREAMLRTYEDAGGVILHAAGVDLDGAGVLVCGPRGAGKTTITAALLRTTGAALLSNDRLVIHHDQMVAVPLPVPTARGTIEAFPELEHVARAQARAADLSGMPTEFGSTIKLAFSARQFAEAFGARLVAASVPRIVLVPRLSDTSEPAALRHLPHAEARHIIAMSCFTPHDEFWIRPWIVPRERADDLLHNQAAAAVGHIAATVPSVEVTFGVHNSTTELVRSLDKAIGGIR